MAMDGILLVEVNKQFIGIPYLICLLLGNKVATITNTRE